MSFPQATSQGVDIVMTDKPLQVTCLITAVPIEGESIEVEITSDIDKLEDNINFILQNTWTRLRQINMMLLEDMDVYNKLSKDQYDILMKIINKQFPYQPLGNAYYFNAASTRILVRKMTNHKEQIALRAAGQFSATEVHAYLTHLLKATEQRMIETNRNDLDAYDILKQQSPEDQMILQLVLDTIYGRMQPDVAANRLQSYANEKDKGEANVN